MFVPRGHARPARGKPARPACPVSMWPVRHRQLVLFGWPRDLKAGRALGFPAPRDPVLAAWLDELVGTHAAHHGWSKTSTGRTRQVIRVLLGLQDTPGAPIKATDIIELRHLHLPADAAMTVLASVGMLDDDRTPAIDGWFGKQIAGLPEPMIAELRLWYEVMRFGSQVPPRFRPKAEITIRTRIRWALPALQTWAEAGHLSLREISRAQVREILPPSGTPRATMGTALRSIFLILKGRKVIFTNPISGIRTGRPETREPLPVAVAALRDALHSGDPEQAALAALVAFCGLRGSELRDLMLTDARDGRLHVGDRVILLAAPVRERLSAYLTYRNRRWPNSANAHLFINIRSATHTRGVHRLWVNRRLGMAVQAIREDRILHEAQASGGDIRRLCDLFGLSVAGAARYTATVDHPSLAAHPHTSRPQPGP
jgi:integrase